MLLVNCNSSPNDNFKDIYQREICDKYSLYANSKDLNGSLSLYAEDAIVNNSTVEPIVGINKIKENFIEWYESAETINHSATVISAKVFVVKKDINTNAATNSFLIFTLFSLILNY